MVPAIWGAVVPWVPAAEPRGAEVPWAELRALVARGAIKESKLLSHHNGKPYKDVPEQGAVLVGFDLFMTPFKESESTVRGIRAVFQTERGELRGEIHGKHGEGVEPVAVVAKPGYAVAKVVGEFDRVAIRRLRVHFERVAGTRLDGRDEYKSEWFGAYKDRLTDKGTIDTDGSVPVGISGHSGLGLDGLRLISVNP